MGIPEGNRRRKELIMKIEMILGQAAKKALKKELPVKVTREQKELPFSRKEKRELKGELLALWGEE